MTLSFLGIIFSAAIEIQTNKLFTNYPNYFQTFLKLTYPHSQVINNENIEQFYRDVESLRLKFPVASIAKKTGFNKGSVSQYLNRNLEPSENFINAFYLEFGKSLKNVSRESSSNEVQEPVTGFKPNGKETYLDKRRAHKNTSPPFMVPLVPVKAQAGYARAYNNTDFINELELYPLLRGVDPRGAVWRYFEIQGDSMEPALFETDLVLVSMVPQEDWKDIRKGQVYVIVTDEDVLIKIIYPKDKDHWILKSSNAKHKDRVIAVTDVRELWYYRRHVTSKLQLTKK